MREGPLALLDWDEAMLPWLIDWLELNSACTSGPRLILKGMKLLETAYLVLPSLFSFTSPVVFPSLFQHIIFSHTVHNPSFWGPSDHLATVPHHSSAFPHPLSFVSEICLEDVPSTSFLSSLVRVLGSIYAPISLFYPWPVPLSQPYSAGVQSWSAVDAPTVSLLQIHLGLLLLLQ